MICCCCGVYVAPGAGEQVIIGIDGQDAYMCRRCFNEDCDCNDLRDPTGDYDPEWYDEGDDDV